ncbi:MAG TPA: hypothetical protein VGL81_10355 [Polyangiaceae bacterium]
MLFALFSAAVHGGAGALALAHARATGGAPAPAFDTTSPALTGETLEVEPVGEEPGAEVAQDHESAPPAVPGVAPIAPRNASPSMHAPHPASWPSAPGATKPALFGAVGVRFATDLATTFTRAFPQAASADAVWATVPFGSAGTADVTLTLDDAGRLTASSVTGAPSPALRRGIERTLALLGPRAFTASGMTTRLRVAARVGKDDVHDGLHGDVFALSGGSFAGEVGTAFFALPAAGGGRRIDVELRLEPSR